MGVRRDQPLPLSYLRGWAFFTRPFFVYRDGPGIYFLAPVVAAPRRGGFAAPALTPAPEKRVVRGSGDCR